MVNLDIKKKYNELCNMKYYLPIIIFIFIHLSSTSEELKPGNNNYNFNNPPPVSSPYLDSISISLNNLYDSVNIWWKYKYQVSDSILKIKVPIYPEYIYNKRIEYLNEITPIKLEYNEHVQKYIDAYGVRNREKLQSIISRSALYFPIFEEYLDKYNLPLELKYLAAVESALDPNAVSKSGAVGLWQFMKPTAEIFDLKITSFIDERKDVHKSTEAACRYLKYLYQTFEDWQLALAAYNGGPGALTKAIARSGGKKNYWELRPLLTNQMQNYVPAFIAMNYLMVYHAEHNIFPDSCLIEAIKIDTILVEGPLYLRNISEFTGCDYDMIKTLNPVFNRSYIPKDGERYVLTLPGNYVNLFLENKDSIYSLSTNTPDSPKEDVNPLKNTGKRTNFIYYEIVSGDNLFRLAIKYNCSIDDILKWNNLDNSYIPRVKDKLKIYIE